MHKTSVYLPEPLKAGLAALARRQNRSEAELLRSAVEALVNQATEHGTPTTDTLANTPFTRHRLATGPCLVGVGVGPGDEELLTLRAVRTLRELDRVFAPCTSADAIGRAEAIVREAVPGVIVERLVFVMDVDSAARDLAISTAADRVVEALDSGERVGFITLGDPNVYSTFSSIADGVRTRRPAATISSIPGIMAFQELAAQTGTVVVDGNEELHLLPLHASTEGLAQRLAETRGAVVIYKGGRHIPALAKTLRDVGRLDGSVLGELLGMTGGRAVSLASVCDRPASYLATVIVPPSRNIAP